MITVTEARNLIMSNLPPRRTMNLALEKAVGFVLAEDIYSVCDVPQFDNSAMDGYAFQFKNWNGNPLTIQGESAAGKPFAGSINSTTGVRIFTGAMMPEGSDTVVMQEKVTVEGNQIYIQDTAIVKHSNVRFAGAQNKKGELLLRNGSPLTPGTVGWLAGCGIAEVVVYAKPKISILVTGDEIVRPGLPLTPGQVFECNSYSLQAALMDLGVVPEVLFCKDFQDEIESGIRRALLECDILLVSGGVSVGDYDFVVPALLNCGVEPVFHGVKQKPAKPLFVGKTHNQLIFGLPGNPASVLTSFYVYVMPVIKLTSGMNMKSVQRVLSNTISRKPGLTQFYKAVMDDSNVSWIGGQESFRMDSFAQANCLIEVPENLEKIEAGSVVNIVVF